MEIGLARFVDARLHSIMCACARVCICMYQSIHVINVLDDYYGWAVKERCVHNIVNPCDPVTFCFYSIRPRPGRCFARYWAMRRGLMSKVTVVHAYRVDKMQE